MTMPKFAKAFEVAKIRCKNYPNCLDIVPLAEIERHEKILCKYQACKQCNRSLKQGTVSMQAHLELHCEESNMNCYFCKKSMTRRELMKKHTCDAVYPVNKFMIKHDMVVNGSTIPRAYKAITTCHFCGNYLRRASQCSSCLISACGACINASQGSQPSMSCPNKVCGIANRF